MTEYNTADDSCSSSLNAEQCEAAANAEIGRTYAGTVTLSNAPNACYLKQSTNEIYYNLHSEGSYDNNNNIPLCLKGDLIILQQ